MTLPRSDSALNVFAFISRTLPAMTIESTKAIIAKIREHYASQGIPLDGLSDRQIEIGVRQLAAAAREAGMSAEEATEKMREAVAQAGEAPQSNSE